MKALHSCLLFVAMIFSLSGWAQRTTIDNTLPDSLTAARTRSALNSLPATDYIKQTYYQNDSLLHYRLLTPVDVAANNKYPLIITLHNSSRIGDDNEKQLEPMARIWLRDDIRWKYKAYVLAPQFTTRSSNYQEDSLRHTLVSIPSSDVWLLLALIKQVQEEYKDIDPARIYLVGYSMGGSTAQNLMSLAPELFAAMVSVAAVPDFSNIAAVSTKPVWLIHGQKDDENPYIGSRQLFEAMPHNRQLLFTTYTQLDHNVITIPLLLSNQVPQWLFKQYKKR
ncbi:Prolyl oligopeptidase family protein [Filimonas lacunae]|uniref:Prolyl oligopeptidase family protein n=1 Tax=Filimonas lacunae TaxID=477680 RepID=A0A173MHW4_9BACT|nr:alpha/beta fold hydrolase [Filimonas lacunae]BAV07089.1 hypothetical protein FLA_3109 [Filimonas lacunae]SIS95148.1 Prolyl oligopeptidase family protein [Filimonas lacunae]